MTTYKGIPKSRIIMLAIAALVGFIVNLSFMYLNEQFKILVFHTGFGMDSHGTLYVSTNRGIQKYKDGVLTGSINTEVSQNKKLVILKDDTILLETNPDYTRIDSNGNELEHIEKDNVDSQTFEAYGHLIFRFTSSEGTEYCVKHPFLRTTVYSETGETIFQMSLRDYIVRLCFIIYFISAFGFGIWFVLSTVMLMKKHSITNKIKELVFE